MPFHLPGRAIDAQRNMRNSQIIKWKFHSKLVMLQKDGDEILCTYINKDKKYPYNSIKRGWK